MAVVGVPVVVAITLAGGAAFVALVSLTAAVAALEITALFRRSGSEPHRVLAVVVSAAAPVALAFPSPFVAAGVAGVLALGAPAASILRAREGRKLILDVAATVWAALYAGWLPAHLVLLSRLGDRWALYVIVLTWILDTAAYGVGRTMGRHRLAPRVSPGKTWEGAAGGVLLTALAAVALRGWFKGALSGAEALITGFVVALFGIAGDLFESRMKREAGVKDASGLLPGHGGVLDRCDSLFFTAPAVYYLARIVTSS